MLSILIPIYNFEVSELVADLHRQCLLAEIDFEICCFDDGSIEKFKTANRAIEAHSKVVYKELSINQGRSKIRNTLGKAASYNYLLFMDCDSKVTHPNYIQNYIDGLQADRLLYGGRTYTTTPPQSPDLFFHWFYGSQREQQSANHRKTFPYHSFMTNNFVIPKKLFLALLFDEQLTQYGHEDTIFGLELKQRNIPIIHLDNPLEHIGLENTTVFLDKTQKALENLFYLSQKNNFVDTKLLRAYQKSKQFRLHYPIKKMYMLNAKKITKNLHSSNPSLCLFDYFKLAELIRIGESQLK